jgi:hypothetical protein
MTLHMRRGEFGTARSLALEGLTEATGDDQREQWLLALARVDALSGDLASSEAIRAEVAHSESPKRSLALLELADTQAWQGKTVDALRNSLRYATRAVLGEWETIAVADVIAIALSAERLSPEPIAILQRSRTWFAAFGIRLYPSEEATWARLEERAHMELTPAEQDAVDRIGAELTPTAALELAIQLAQSRLARE